MLVHQRVYNISGRTPILCNVSINPLDSSVYVYKIDQHSCISMMYIYNDLYIYICIYLYAYIYIHTYVHIYIYTHMCVCKYIIMISDPIIHDIPFSIPMPGRRRLQRHLRLRRRRCPCHAPQQRTVKMGARI